MHFMNCLTEPFFDIPTTQVCIPRLHMTQDIFIKLIRLLEDTCHQFDLQLTYMFTRQEESTSSSSLKTLVVAKAKMAEAQESSAVLEAAVTYVVVEYGEDSPITKMCIQQART
ncbi:hypothetical protein EMCRGX_G024610 [Ephydatia muelleri]